MNKQRDDAARALREAQAEYAMISWLRDQKVWEQPEFNEAIDRLFKRADEAYDRAAQKVKRLEHHNHCHWQRFQWIVRGNTNVRVSYTSDADGDGWYWWRVDFGKVKGPFNWIERTIEGKYRTRRKAIDTANHKYIEYRRTKRIAIPQAQPKKLDKPAGAVAPDAELEDLPEDGSGVAVDDTKRGKGRGL